MILLFTSAALLAQVTVTYPKPYIVIQRDNQNQGTVHITGTVSEAVDRIEARFLTIDGEPGESSGNWFTLDNSLVNGMFYGHTQVPGGRYDLEVRGMRGAEQVGNVTTVGKVGIGEVFLIVGHSNAQGSGGTPASSSMVISMDPNADESKAIRYDQTADPEQLPTDYSPLTEGHGIAPFAGNPWFWGKFGDQVVKKLNVPVLIYSAAFGGSNMEQTYKAAKGEYFEHGFIKANLRMPYINIENTLFHLVPQTGLRAIISGHGINDNGSTEDQFYEYHKGVIEHTRATEKFRSLAWMVANSCYNDGVKEQILRAQDRIIQLENVFRGPNLNSIDNSGRRDGLHFNELGQELASIFWSDAVIQESFLANSQPIMPDLPKELQGTLPVRLAEFSAREAEFGALQLNWTTTEEINNEHFEIQYSYNAREFHSGGRVEGAVNSTTGQHYSYTLSGPFSGNVYLRLKQVDLDGSFDYSNVVVVAVKGQDSNQFYPNPSSGHFTLQTAGDKQPRSIKIYDLAGIQVLEVQNSSEVNLSGLPSSVYIAVVEGVDGLRVVKRISKI